MGKGKVLLYGEPTVQVNIRVPESKKEEVYEKFKVILAEYENPKRYLALKEPTKTTFVPFTAKKIMVVGYACFKDEDSDVCYWKDSPTTALIFDNELHLKDYLTKFKP